MVVEVGSHTEGLIDLAVHKTMIRTLCALLGQRCTHVWSFCIASRHVLALLNKASCGVYIDNIDW